jgi:molecular chaperone DnaK (HSP70)
LTFLELFTFVVETMVVAGFDFGNASSYIAVARDGGIEVLTNEYSLHATQ